MKAMPYRRPHPPQRDHDLQPLCIQGEMPGSMHHTGEILLGLALVVQS